MPLAHDARTVQRILVYGVTGSGKTTAAQRLGHCTGLPVTLVDELTWLPGWVTVDVVTQREKIAAITSTERWILDTAYGSWLDLVLPRAELILALDYPRWVSLTRLLRRTVRAAVTKEPLCNGNVETVRNILGRDSIIRWHFRSFPRKRQRMRQWAEATDGPPVVLVRNQHELDSWLNQLGHL